METNVSSVTAAKCAECRGTFPADEMIRHGNAFVCAACKPVFMQKLAEGAEIRTGDLRYAGFWLRFGALLLDGLILVVINTALQLIAGLSLAQIIGTEPRNGVLLAVVLGLIQIAIAISYETILVGKYGATVGKMACKIKVVTSDGGSVSYMRALGRYFAKTLNAFTLFIGFLIAAFDSEKRTLHDRICNTRVVLK